MSETELEKEILRYDNGGWAEIHTLNGQHHGPWTVFREDGSKSWERFHQYGQKSGLDRSWFKGGQLDYERSYFEDELDGVWKTWHQNGQLKSERHFSNGIQTGLARWFLATGEILAELKISENGKRTGTQIAEFIETSGLRLGIAEYKDGKYIGFVYFEELPDGYRLSR
jgi:antitoxin component YwqK of YwqJK toxin-antitoxin module